MLYPLSYGGLTGGSLPVMTAGTCAAQSISFGNFDKTSSESARRTVASEPWS